MLTLFLALCCFWLALPLIRPFLVLSLWILTRRIFWISLVTIMTITITLCAWQNHLEELAVAKARAWDREHSAPTVIAPVPTPTPVLVSAEEKAQKSFDQFAAQCAAMPTHTLELTPLTEDSFPTVFLPVPGDQDTNE